MEIRAVVHYFYLTGVPAASAAALLQATYKDQSMTRTGVLTGIESLGTGGRQSPKRVSLVDH